MALTDFSGKLITILQILSKGKSIGRISCMYIVSINLLCFRQLLDFSQKDQQIGEFVQQILTQNVFFFCQDEKAHANYFSV